MDQAVLVEQAQHLTERLDATKEQPRAVMWVHQQDTDVWRLWIVPHASITDKREFYRLIAEVITAYQGELAGLDVGAIEYVSDKHPAMVGMGQFLQMDGIGSATFQGNRFNGYYMPDGIVIRMRL